MAKNDYKHFSYMGHSVRYRKIKNGKWQATIYLGKRPTEKGTKSNVTKQITATSEKALKEQVKEYIVYNGFQGKINFSTKKTIEELAREWFNIEKKPVERGLKPKTIQRIDEILNNQIIPYFGDYELNKLDTDTINNVLKYLAQDCGMRKGYSYSTLKKIRIYLNQMYEYALSKKYCRENPTTYVIVPVDNKEKQAADFDIKTFTFEELDKYIKFATEVYSNGKPIYRYGWGLVFLVFSGLRVGEALALNWKDIDIEKGIIYIRKSLSDNVKDLRNPKNPNGRITVVGTPKTKSSIRNVVLNQSAIEALNNLKEITNPDNIINRPVFSNKDGKPVKYGNLRRAHENIMAKVGIEDKKGSIHILRHAYATFLHENNVNDYAIADELGHSSVDITRKYYIHPIKEKSNPNVEQIRGISF